MTRTRRFDVFVNARAGSVDDAAALEREILDAFDAAADGTVDAYVHVVEPDDLGAAALERWRRDQPEAVVVAGGDGTVDAVLDALAGTDAVLGVLPLGTFNHFAADLGMPDDLPEAAAAIVHGQTRAVDLAEVNGRCFANNALVGVYPEAVAVRDAVMDARGWGKLRAVPVAVLVVLRRFPLHRVDVHSDRGVLGRRLRTPLVFVGNGRYEHDGPGRVTRTSLTAGELGIEIAATRSRWALVRTALHALVRGMDAPGALERHVATELVLASRARRIRVAYDGEVDWFTSPLRFRVRPGALRVRVASARSASGHVVSGSPS